MQTQTFLDLSNPFLQGKKAIKARTEKYKGLSVIEAFEREYGLDLSRVGKSANDVPEEVSLGSKILLQIGSVTKNGTDLVSKNHKEYFVTRNNLWSYPQLRMTGPGSTVTAKVVDKIGEKVFVDILGPMRDEFLEEVSAEPWRQNGVDGGVPVQVKNLRLTRGGFIGDAVIPNVSSWLGEDYTVEAFVPGSQIVLNTTRDFDSFVGSTVDTFVMSYNPNATSTGIPLVCSAKAYLKHLGNINLINIYEQSIAEDKEPWNEFNESPLIGKVTGILHSARKCGVFIELPELNITGMAPCAPDRLSYFHPGDLLHVRLKEFEILSDRDPNTGKTIQRDPYIIEDGCVKSVNIRPVFSFE